MCTIICSALEFIQPLDNPSPKSALAKKGSSNLRGIWTSEVLKFPEEKHNVAIITLLKAATRLEKSLPEGCIALQRRAMLDSFLADAHLGCGNAYLSTEAIRAIFVIEPPAPN